MEFHPIAKIFLQFRFTGILNLIPQNTSFQIWNKRLKYKL